MAEAILSCHGGDRHQAFSVGSFPKGEVHPMAIEILAGHGLVTEGLRSKSWNEFAGPLAPLVDFIFTVCDSAAGEVCPVWPGHPITVHWSIDDPAAAEGPEQRKAFVNAYEVLHARISAFLALPIEKLDEASLKGRLRAIGNSASEESAVA
jgi:arsenate reductase